MKVGKKPFENLSGQFPQTTTPWTTPPCKFPRDNCPQDNSPPGLLPPRQLPQDNCPQTTAPCQFPPDIPPGPLPLSNSKFLLFLLWDEVIVGFQRQTLGSLPRPSSTGTGLH